MIFPKANLQYGDRVDIYQSPPIEERVAIAADLQDKYIKTKVAANEFEILAQNIEVPSGNAPAKLKAIENLERGLIEIGDNYESAELQLSSLTKQFKTDKMLMGAISNQQKLNAFKEEAKTKGVNHNDLAILYSHAQKNLTKDHVDPVTGEYVSNLNLYTLPEEINHNFAKDFDTNILKDFKEKYSEQIGDYKTFEFIDGGQVKLVGTKGTTTVTAQEIEKAARSFFNSDPKFRSWVDYRTFIDSYNIPKDVQGLSQFYKEDEIELMNKELSEAINIHGDEQSAIDSLIRKKLEGNIIGELTRYGTTKGAYEKTKYDLKVVNNEVDKSGSGKGSQTDVIPKMTGQRSLVQTTRGIKSIKDYNEFNTDYNTNVANITKDIDTFVQQHNNEINKESDFPVKYEVKKGQVILTKNNQQVEASTINPILEIRQRQLQKVYDDKQRVEDLVKQAKSAINFTENTQKEVDKVLTNPEEHKKLITNSYKKYNFEMTGSPGIVLGRGNVHVAEKYEQQLYDNFNKLDLDTKKLILQKNFEPKQYDKINEELAKLSSDKSNLINYTSITSKKLDEAVQDYVFKSVGIENGTVVPRDASGTEVENFPRLTVDDKVHIVGYGVQGGEHLTIFQVSKKREGEGGYEPPTQDYFIKSPDAVLAHSIEEGDRNFLFAKYDQMAEAAVKTPGISTDFGLDGYPAVKLKWSGVGTGDNFAPDNQFTVGVPVDGKIQNKNFGSLEEVYNFYNGLIDLKTDKRFGGYRIPGSAGEEVSREMLNEHLTGFNEEALDSIYRVIDFETGGTMSTKAKNLKKDGSTQATGLIQFTNTGLKGLQDMYPKYKDLTLDGIENLSVDEQLGMVKDYLAPYSDIINQNPDYAYLAVFYPALMSYSRTTKLNEIPAWASRETEIRKGNPAFDNAKTVGDIIDIVKAYKKE